MLRVHLASTGAALHNFVMIWPLLLAIAPDVATASTGAPCLPMTADQPSPVPSAMEDHRALRRAMGEPMPKAAVMVMLYGEGGHLSTRLYSIALVRSADGAWHGTAVGRSKIWVQDAPYTPMTRAEWVLDKVAGNKLDGAVAHRCLSSRKLAEVVDTGPPPLGFIPERIDVVTPTLITTFYADQGGTIAALIRPER